VLAINVIIHASFRKERYFAYIYTLVFMSVDISYCKAQSLHHERFYSQGCLPESCICIQVKSNNYSLLNVNMGDKVWNLMEVQFNCASLGKSKYDPSSSSVTYALNFRPVYEYGWIDKISHCNCLHAYQFGQSRLQLERGCFLRQVFVWYVFI
jgi:hypothetical protein